MKKSAALFLPVLALLAFSTIGARAGTDMQSPPPPAQNDYTANGYWVPYPTPPPAPPVVYYGPPRGYYYAGPQPYPYYYGPRRHYYGPPRAVFYGPQFFFRFHIH